MIKFNSEKLNRVHPAVDLRRYDALYFEGENQVSASKDEEANGDNEQTTGGGTVGVEAEALGPGDAPGSGKDEGSGAGSDLEVPESVDLDREIGAAQFDDPEQDKDCEVPPGSDSGEL